MSEQQKQTAKAWAKALLAAIITSAAVAAAAWDGSDFKDLGRAIVVASVVGAALFLKQSPLPPQGMIILELAAWTVFSGVMLGVVWWFDL